MPNTEKTDPSSFDDSRNMIETGKAATQSSSTQDQTNPQLNVGWWNIEHASSVWFDEQFWHFIDSLHILFLTETHHDTLPAHPERQVIGQDRRSDGKAGGPSSQGRACDDR